MSPDLGFLDDESLTDNLPYKLTVKIIAWLEDIAGNHAADQPQALNFIRMLNRYFKDEDKQNKNWIFYDLFKILMEKANPQDPLFITLAKYTLNKGEESVK